MKPWGSVTVRTTYVRTYLTKDVERVKGGIEFEWLIVKEVRQLFVKNEDVISIHRQPDKTFRVMILYHEYVSPIELAKEPIVSRSILKCVATDGKVFYINPLHAKVQTRKGKDWSPE